MEGHVVGVVVEAGPAVYADIADVRAAGADAGLLDAQITVALEIAASLINGFTSSSFGTAVQEARTVTDCRTREVVLPEPFSAVTAVSVAGYALTTGQWEVDTFGIRLYPVTFKDASGLPVVNGFDCPLSGPWSQYGQLGLDVTVTATWGYAAIPVAVQQASILLALDFLRGPGTGAVGYNDQLRSLSVEGFSIGLAGATAGEVTTGNVMANRLLEQFRQTRVGCG